MTVNVAEDNNFIFFADSFTQTRCQHASKIIAAWITTEVVLYEFPGVKAAIHPAALKIPQKQ